MTKIDIKSSANSSTKHKRRSIETTMTPSMNNVVIGRSHNTLNMLSYQVSSPPWYYTGVINLLAPFYRFKVRQRSKKNDNYQQEIDDRFGERYQGGNLWLSQKDKKPIIWCHAVSLGETNTIAPLLKSLLSEGYQIWLTNTTQTGYARVKKLFAEELVDGQVQHSYMPIDKNQVITRFLQHVQPNMALFVETELWANMLFQLSKRNIVSILINARLSEKSYQNYLKIARVSETMMKNIGLIIAQDAESAKRFRLLGADSSKIRVAGSLKWTVNSMTKPNLTDIKSVGSTDYTPEKKDIKNHVKDSIDSRTVWVAASTHLGEESVALSAHKKLIATAGLENALLILVPRHPERFDEVANMVAQSGLTFCRRSQLSWSTQEKLPQETDEKSDLERQNNPINEPNFSTKANSSLNHATQVFLADSMGELSFWYELADVAFVGGSMVNVGGHNPIEALVAKSPVIMGNYTYSLQAVVEQLISSHVLHLVSLDYEHVKGNDIDEINQKKLADLLYERLKLWLSNKDNLRELGQIGFDLVQKNQEVINKQRQMIVQILEGR